MKHFFTSIALVLRRISWPTWGDADVCGSTTALLMAERGLDPALGPLGLKDGVKGFGRNSLLLGLSLVTMWAAGTALRRRP